MSVMIDTTNAQPAKPKGHMLALPAELRNRIFVFAIVSSRPLTVDLDKAQTRASVAEPALTRANLQIRSESLPVFYGQNDFIIGPFYNERYFRSCTTWLRSLGPKIALILHITLKPCRACDFSFMLTAEPEQRLRFRVADLSVGQQCWFNKNFDHASAQSYFEGAAVAGGDSATTRLEDFAWVLREITGMS